MSSIIKFSTAELRKLASSGNACVQERRVTTSLALQPWCLGNLEDSIKNLLDYKIGKYNKEYEGILLSYKNLHILQNFGAIRNDNTDIHFQVQADFFIFHPYIGATLTGIVNKKSFTHLGILVHRVFNVVIPRPTEEPDNRWIGTRVREGQQVIFKIVMLDLFGALPYIRGELDERSIEETPEIEYDEEMEDALAGNLNVSHIDFDKTKPQSTEQLSESNNESVTPPPTEKKSYSRRNKSTDDKQKSPSPEKHKATGKKKSKRERLSESPSQQELKSRTSKKQKRKES